MIARWRLERRNQAIHPTRKRNQIKSNQIKREPSLSIKAKTILVLVRGDEQKDNGPNRILINISTNEFRDSAGRGNNMSTVNNACACCTPTK
jgi:hypothetical protein